MDLPNDDSQKPVNPPSSVANSADNATRQVDELVKKIEDAKLPQDLNDRAMGMTNRLKLISHESNFFLEYDNIARYINWVTSLPWNHSSEDILDLNHALQVLNKNHYGLNDVKEKILEFLSIMIVKKARGKLTADAFARAPIIALVGLVGVGKTTIAFSIAEALGREIIRIPFGGMGSAVQLRGKTRMQPDAEPGLIIKGLRQAKTNNPVMLLDEIDRISAEARSDIMGVLVELLDPQQNKNFVDHYIDYPFDLSNVMFIATSNNTKDISTAVLDRLEIIQMPSYTDEEKIFIAKTFMFPQVLTESGLTTNDLVVSDDTWEDIVRPLGYDSGIRSLKRVVQGMVRRAALLMLEGKIPQNAGFRITRENVKSFLPQW